MNTPTQPTIGRPQPPGIIIEPWITCITRTRPALAEAWSISEASRGSSQ